MLKFNKVNEPLLDYFRLLFRENDLEAEYRQFNEERHYLSQRVILIIGILFFASFAFYDYSLQPYYLEEILIARLGVFTPLMLLIWIFSTSAFGRKNYSWFASAVVLLCASGISFIVHRTSFAIADSYTYGLVLTLIFSFILVDTRFLMTLLNFLIISIIYFAVLSQKVSVPAEYFAKQAILFSSLGFTLMAGRYTLEYYKRIDFLTKKRLEAEKQKVKKAFQREKILNDAKGRFTNVIAHVFRTPLATIQNNIHILEYKAKTVGLDISKEKDLLLRSTENISYNIERAQFIIKYDSGKILPEISAFSLQDLLQEVADEINRIESLNRIFRINIDAEKDIIQSDRILLKKILLNFASNAAKFSRRDTEVNISCFLSKNEAEIYVIDTGYGIPSEQLENIFDIYYHFSSDPMIMGMGLGLAIIKRCADMLGATVRLDSQEKQGTSAYIKVPFAQFNQNNIQEDANRFKESDHLG